LVVTSIILGTPCIMGEKIREEFGKNSKVRVPDDPSAIVEPKILGVETFWDKRDSQIPSEKFKREARLCRNLSRDLFLI